MADNKISANRIDIYEKLLTIAKSNFTDYENYDFMRSGGMGWAFESMAMAIRDTGLQSTMLYKEHFLNTAVMPETIYNMAKQFKVNVINATPAQANVFFQIEVNALRQKIETSAMKADELAAKYGISSNSAVIVIDKSNPIIAGDYYFSLEHSIAISQVRQSNSISSSTFLVQYCVNESIETTEFENYSNPIIPISIAEYNGVQYLVFQAVAYQYKITTVENLLTSTNFISTKVYDFTFEDQLAGLSMNYQRGSQSLEHIALYFDNLSKPASAMQKYGYYNLKDEHTIEVVFANSAAGLPQNGGILYLTMLETKGSEGNISFSGNATMIITDNELLRDLPLTVSFADGVAIGGVDAPTLDEIKSRIVEELSTRNTIITESDLNRFFKKNAALLSDINGSSVKFVKEKDTILKRSFNAYLMLRYGTENSTNKYANKVVPTNTVDVVWRPVEVENNGSINSTSENSIVLQQTDKIYYNHESNKYHVAKNPTSSDDEDIIYSVPFYTEVNLYPFKKTHYVYTGTNDSAQLQITNINSLECVLIPSTITVFKDIGDPRSEYTVTFNIISDIALTEGQNINNFASLIIYRNDNNSEIISINDSNIINIVEESDYSEDSSLHLYKINVRLTAPDNNESLFNFGVDSSSINLKIGNITSSFPSNVKLGLKLNGVVAGKYINVSFASKTYLSLFEELDDILSSDIEISGSTTQVDGIKIKGVPVVLNRWFEETVEKREAFIKQLLVYINFLRKNIDRLESNTFFNLKFFNTYGPSYLFNTVRTNVRLQLDVYFKASVSDDIKDDLCKSIRLIIRTIVEQGNDEGSLKVSDVIMKTNALFVDYIDHIEFNGMNGSFNQYINALESVDESQYALEYFNLDTTKELSGANTSANYRINDDIRFYSYGENEPYVETSENE